jgi:hypothetical protein
MNQNLRKLEAAASGVLAIEDNLSPYRIRQVLHQFSSLQGYEVTDCELESLAKDFENRHRARFVDPPRQC